MSEIIYLKPFTKFCMTIGAIPSSYLLSLSYEEQLLWFCDYIQNTIIPTINNNSDAVKEIQNNFNENTQKLLNEFINLKNYVNSYFENLDLSQEVSNKLDEMAESGQLQELFDNLANNKLDNYSRSNQAIFSDDLLTDNSKWITEGWTGTRETGFQHLVGQSTPLIYNDTFNKDDKFVLSFDVQSNYPPGSQNASNAFSVILGNSHPIITYRGGGSMHYDIGLTPAENGNLQFILCNPTEPTQSSTIFDGKILNITLKKFLNNLQQIDISDKNNLASNSITVTESKAQNTIIGTFAGISNYSQNYNTYLGFGTAKNDISGYFNVGIGWNTLANNINGSRNVSIGYNAHNYNISGDRNVAIGPFAMNTSETTRRTIALGYDVMFSNKTGDNNIAIGGVALSGASNSEDNIAIGHSALSIPANSTLGSRNIAIGNQSLLYKTEGNGCIAIGYQAQYHGNSGKFNVSIGNNSLGNMRDGNSVIGIGNGAGTQLTSGLLSLIAGSSICNSLKQIEQSVIVGVTSLNNTNLNSITNSAIFGRNINTELPDLRNILAFGNNIKITQANDFMYLGGIITANLSNLYSLPRVGIGIDNPTARLHLRAGSNLQQSAPIKIDAGSKMTTPEDGAIEYDGTNLYFTVGTTRHIIQFQS